MPDLRRMWMDEVEELEQDVWNILFDSTMAYSWGPNGFGNPPVGQWRKKNGKLIDIVDMTTSHILNCLKLLHTRFSEQYDTWPIVKRLRDELDARGIDHDGKKDWDS